jgi:hypothetical protein
MKRFILCASLICFLTLGSQGQNVIQTKEYCTVYMKVFYQGNIILYDEKGLSKSPIVTMPDGKVYFAYDVKKKFTQDEKGHFLNAGQVINSFAEYGWELHSSEILNYDAGDRSQASVIIDVNQYFQLLTFARPFIPTSPKPN